jgi:hypothetical protein
MEISPCRSTPSTHWIGGWAGSRAGLDAVILHLLAWLPGFRCYLHLLHVQIYPSPLSPQTSSTCVGVIKPSWTYGQELWGCASESNVAIIQISQSKILRQIANAPWYVTNNTLHTDLQVLTIQESIRKKATAHHHVLVNHPNMLMNQLLEPVINKRLKRKLWPSELF